MSLLAERNPRAGEHTHSGETMVPDKSRAERKTSYAVDDFPVPGGREEDWRFTPVDRLSALFHVAPTDSDKVTVDVQAPEGVEVDEVTAGESGVGKPADRVSAVAWAGEEKATRVRIGAEAELAEPVRIVVSATDLARVNGHLVVEAGAHSRGTVVLSHRGSAECGANVEIKVGDGADITFVTVQEWDDDAVHVAQNDALIGRDARLRHIAVTLSGKVVRLSTNARYSGPGGSFEGLGVYFADAGEHQEHRLFVDHGVPHCHSNVEYKGALQGESAHTVWVGDVLIRASAEGTDTYELNRNLVLTDGTRVDSVPNLEILTGEVAGAGHASASGRLDDQHLFYLQARGIPYDTARRMVVRGFLGQLVDKIDIPGLKERVMAAIDEEIAR